MSGRSGRPNVIRTGSISPKGNVAAAIGADTTQNIPTTAHGFWRTPVYASRRPEYKAYQEARRSDPVYRARTSEYHRGHYQENKEYYRVTRQKYRRALRQEMIEAYGGICSCCHEDESAFLSLEHLNGDGKAHRLQFGERGNSDGVVRDLKRRGWPKDGYTILCFNCNMGKAVNGGICPHVARPPSQ